MRCDVKLVAMNRSCRCDFSIHGDCAFRAARNVADDIQLRQRESVARLRRDERHREHALRAAARGAPTGDQDEVLL